MRNSYLAICLFFLFALMGLNFQCERDFESKPFEQTFQIPVQISPFKKSYPLSDTIWIQTEVPNKFLFDTKTAQSINADSGRIDFSAVFNRFGTDITNPAGGFCDIITSNGINIERGLAQWSTAGSFSNYGCSQPDYRVRIGFVPKVRGTYWLVLFKDILFGSCTNKVNPYYASLSFKYTNPDLNLDVFNALPDDIKGGNNGKGFYTEKINNKEVFIIRVD
jgi:hypothetical protein